MRLKSGTSARGAEHGLGQASAWRALLGPQPGSCSTRGLGTVASGRERDRRSQLFFFFFFPLLAIGVAALEQMAYETCL